MQNFPGKTLAVLDRDVRKIRDNHIETSLHVFQQIAFKKADASSQIQPGSILLRERERIIRNAEAAPLRRDSSPDRVVARAPIQSTHAQIPGTARSVSAPARARANARH